MPTPRTASTPPKRQQPARCCSAPTSASSRRVVDAKTTPCIDPSAPRSEEGIPPIHAIPQLVKNTRELEDELAKLKPSALRKRALQAGATEDECNEADDSEDRDKAIIDLILRKAEAAATAAAAADDAEDRAAEQRAKQVKQKMRALEDELAKLKPSALRKRALQAGATEDECDEADDSEDRDKATIDLILRKAEAAATAAAAADDAEDRAAEQRAKQVKQKMRALEDELAKLKPSALRKRALQAGATEDECNEADDSEDRDKAIIDLILRKAEAAATAAAAADDAEDRAAEQRAKQVKQKMRALEDELAKLKPSALRKRALQAGATEDECDEADDSEDRDKATIDLILRKAEAAATAAAAADDAEDRAAEQRAKQVKQKMRALEDELAKLKPSALRKRALQAGATEDECDEADDSEDRDKATIDLILRKAEAAATVAAAADDAEDRAAEQRAKQVKQKMRALEDELAKLKPSALRKRALQAGATEDECDEADDSEDRDKAIIDLILRKAEAAATVAAAADDAEDRAAEQRAKQVKQKMRALEDELAKLKPSALRKRALQAGATEDECDEADDSEDRDKAIIDLILRVSSNEALQRVDEAKCDVLVGVSQGTTYNGIPLDPFADASLEEINRQDPLFQFLEDLSLDQYYERLRQSGVNDLKTLNKLSDHELNKMNFSRFDRRAFAAGVRSLQLAPTPQSKTRSHAGSASPTSNPQQRHGQLNHNVSWQGKHVMLSYQWDHQKVVKQVKLFLEKQGIPCWMDIHGGMDIDIYDSMAEGVSGAAVIVPFMTEQYESSENCKLELKFAKQSGVSIVPVKLQGGDYKPKGWLGILTAGLIWVPMHESIEFEANAAALQDQISKTRLSSTANLTDDEDEANADLTRNMTKTQREQELLRLAADLDVDNIQFKGTEHSRGYKIPINVPSLPEFHIVTPEMKQLHSLLLDSKNTKVGFYGRGGIGKTVISTWLVRESVDIQLAFDRLVWLPLGQCPNIEKLQDICHTQLGKGKMAPNLSPQERQDELASAMQGQQVLLVLDDLWDLEHEKVLNFLDTSTQSKVLVSSRTRGLLSNAAVVQLQLPRPKEAVDLLMKAANLEHETAPPEAAEIVEQCGRLPLTVGIMGKSVKTLDDMKRMPNELRRLAGCTANETVIRVALNTLTASKSESQNMIDLFFTFGLVREDTTVPLDILTKLFEGYQQTKGRRVCGRHTITQIRKWLAKLLDRSLILGPVDRPSLHDLVLDYCQSQFSEGELANAHAVIVETFRRQRPMGASGDAQWLVNNGDQQVSSYVCNEIGYHIAEAVSDISGRVDVEAWFAGRVGDPQWFCDVPFDAISMSAAKVMGADELDKRAHKMQTEGNTWLAVIFWALAGVTALEDTGRDVAAQFWRECLDIIDSFEPGPDTMGELAPPATQDLGRKSSGTGRSRNRTRMLRQYQIAKDRVHLDIMLRLLSGYDARDFRTYGGTVEKLAQSDVLDPVDAFQLAVSSKFVPTFFEVTGPYDATAVSSGIYQLVEIMVKGFERSEDSGAQLDADLYCCLATMGVGHGLWAVINVIRTDEDWDMVCGVNGDRLLRASDCHVDKLFDLAHTSIAAKAGFDPGCLAGTGWALAVHYGRFGSALHCVGNTVTLYRKMESDSNRVVQLYSMRCVLTSILLPMYMLGHGRRLSELLAEWGYNWEDAEDTMDELCLFISPIACKLKESSAGHAGTSYTTGVTLKCFYALSAPEGKVTQAQVEQLPSVTKLRERTRDSANGGMPPGASHERGDDKHLCYDPVYIAVALVLEKYGLHGRAMEYLEAASDAVRGPGLESIVHAHIIRGRILAQESERDNESCAEFTAAARKARECGLYFYEIMALWQLHKLDPHALGSQALAQIGDLIGDFEATDQELRAAFGADFDATVCKQATQ